MTIAELQEYLVDHYDPDDLLEMLQINSEQLVEAFDHKIEERYEQLILAIGEDE